MNPDFRKVALIAAVLGFLVSLALALRAEAHDRGATLTTRPAAHATTAR